ncbi:MAG: ATP synthase F0 subunit B [Chloroflexi bacterium]|nr:ATP synthase F0 subunit B [Chloroflexota bacterium]
MDILYLIDELESRLTEGRRIPLTSSVVVDEEECFDIINEMRSRIPEEVRQAKKTERERERIIAQAHEEAERIVALARERAKEVLGEQEIVRVAGARAETIIERAQHEADRIKTDADDYVIAVLSHLESQLGSLLTTVQNGIRVVREGVVGQRSAGAGEEGAESS